MNHKRIQHEHNPQGIIPKLAKPLPVDNNKLSDMAYRMAIKKSDANKKINIVN